MLQKWLMKNITCKLGMLKLAALVLAACGGSSDNGSTQDQVYQQAVAAANAKELEASTLGVDAPCTNDQQCSSLQFISPSDWGGFYYKPYSIVSTTAQAASAAAAQQNTLARYANSLPHTPDGKAYPAIVNLPPALACVANKCQAM